MKEQGIPYEAFPHHRSFDTVVADPFPIYRLKMQRFAMIAEKLPKDIQTSTGMKWMRLGAKLNAIGTEVGTGIMDAVWDAVTFPLNAFEEKLRHPNFHKEILHAQAPDVVGETKDLQGRVEKIMSWITMGGQERIYLNHTSIFTLKTSNSGIRPQINPNLIDPGQLV